MTESYPACDPSDAGYLEVDHGHRIYWEVVGDPHGVPAVYLHGGPGSGCSVKSRRLFNPDLYRAVLFDQRGCGRSRPLADSPDADLRTNTTSHLIDDIERLRTHLTIDRWVVVGMSWGVTLGLAYAQTHPERVRGLVLAAVTSGARREIEWITRDMGRLFPREWEQFVAVVPPAEREGDLSASYARLLRDPDNSVRDAAARAWCAWEDTHVSLGPGWQPSVRYADGSFRNVFARLVTHYWSHGCFLAEGDLVAGLSRLAGIPAVLIHGRYDISSPLEVAWNLHRAWPGSELKVIDDAGHGGGSFAEHITAALDSLL